MKRFVTVNGHDTRSNLPVTIIDQAHCPGATTGRRLHERPDYWPDAAQLVCDWLNGQDKPLPGMAVRHEDPSDPLVLWAMRASDTALARQRIAILLREEP